MDKYTERLCARILRSIVIDDNGCWIWQKTKSGGAEPAAGNRRSPGL